MWNKAVAVCLVVLVVGFGVTGYAQRWGWYRLPPRFPEGPPDRHFTFARVMYESVTREPRGQGWYTDYRQLHDASVGADDHARERGFVP